MATTTQTLGIFLFGILTACGTYRAGSSEGGLIGPPPSKDNTWTPQSPQPKWWEAGQAACPEGTKLSGSPPPRGQLVECVRPDGVVHGLSSVWYPNGHEGTLTEYRDGTRNGRWLYWLHGQKLIEGTFKDGRRDGTWTYWFDNSGGFDLDSRLDREHNDKNYVVEQYNNGMLVKTIHYRDGQPDTGR
jgi:hypothetical protein